MEQPTASSPAEMYEHFYGPAIFRPLARVLVDMAPPPVDGAVLDLACGTGIVSRVLAPLVGARGSITAIDINPAMLAVARVQDIPAGAPITWVEADGHSVDLAESHFHAAYCQQGLQFFSDRAAAVKRVRSALRPGGFFAVAAWKSIEHHSLMHAFAEVEARYLGDLGVSYDDLIRPFSFGDRDALHALLADASFVRVSLAEYSVPVMFPDPATFTRSLETAYGAVIPEFIEDRGAFEQFVVAVERDTRAIVERHTDGDSVRFVMPTHIAIAGVS